jgi:hypothetical protein
MRALRFDDTLLPSRSGGCQRNSADPQGVGHDRQRRPDSHRRWQDASIGDEQVCGSEHAAIGIDDGVGRIATESQRPALVRDMFRRRRRSRDCHQRPGAA